MLLVALASLAAGCSSFHREWTQAATLPVPPGDITGRWTGTWQNTNNSHADRLRGILTRVRPGVYRAHFHARYRKILTFAYAVPLEEAGRTGDRIEFTGKANLGMLAGGVYTYAGWASPTNFFSTYHSKYDVGTFTLHRVP